MRTSMRSCLALPVLCLALASLTSALSAHAADQDVAKFYAGKTITLAVPSGPGGGYDTYGRTLARTFGKHIPGQPSIVVQNVLGGGGMVAANNLYNVSPAMARLWAFLPLARSWFRRWASGSRSSTILGLRQ